MTFGMGARIGVAIGLLVALGVAFAVVTRAVGEDRCAVARRTCLAWCDEHRGPSARCRGDCWNRYKRCKRTGWFIWY